MFYFTPCYNFFQTEVEPQQYALIFTSAQALEEEINKTTHEQAQNCQSAMQFQKEIMRKQLQLRYKKSKSKFWTEQEDKLLLELVQNNVKWEELIKNFYGKNIQICKRRLSRLIKQGDRWPKENQALIKHLFQVEKLSWREIQKFLPMYTKKQIKQRYKNFLEVQTIRAKWTIEQDLQLWQMVKQHGHKWVKFTKIFEGRTQLQLKNRYNKLIKPLQDKLNPQKGRNAQQAPNNQQSVI